MFSCTFTKPTFDKEKTDLQKNTMKALRQLFWIIAISLLSVAVSATGLPKNPEKLREMSALEMALAIRFGLVRSEDLVDALIAQIKAHPELNAFITLNEEGARARAKELDAALPLHARGPLHDVPIVLKDDIDVAGLPTTAGTPALKNHVPQSTAPIAQALIDAGAIILGKNNMHELAAGITNINFWNFCGASTGICAVGNPYNSNMFSGGSSGGTAAAIAARMAPAGLGEDTAGSIRIPSSLSGTVGLRPTAGRYPQDGMVLLSKTRDTAGPIARTVEDLVLLDGIITHKSVVLLPVKLRGLRLGVPRTYFYDNLDPGTATQVEKALSKLRQAGVELVEADIPSVEALNTAVSFPVVLFKVTRELPQYLATTNPSVTLSELISQIASPDVQYLIGISSTITESLYLDAINIYRPALQQAYQQYFAANRVDAIIFPTTPLPARPIALSSIQTVELNGQQVPTLNTYIRNTDPGSNAGIPGLSLPIGLTNDSLPVGIELDGPAQSDRNLLRIGLALQRLFGKLPKPDFQ